MTELIDFHKGPKGQLRAADTGFHTWLEITDPSLHLSNRFLLTPDTHKVLQHLQLRFSQILALKPSLMCLSVGISRDSCPKVQTRHLRPSASVLRSPPSAQQDLAKPGRSAASTAGTWPITSHGDT